MGAAAHLIRGRSRATARQKMPITFEFYHGTSMDNPNAIVKDGFKSSDGGYLGKGVYGAYEDKARSFAELSGRHGGNEGALIKCRVTVDENKVKTRTHATNSTQLNGQKAEAVWYPGGGSVKRPEVCITDTSKIEILGIEKVHATQSSKRVTQSRGKQSTNCDSDSDDE